MRYAIISDVHANATALRAVLQDAADARAERIVCLGDVLGYGPDPVETLEFVYRRAHVCLAGNHDAAVAGYFSTELFSTFAAAAVDRHRAALSQEAVDWLRSLPYTCEFQGDGGHSAGSFACTHGDFSDPEAFYYVIDPEDALPSFLERTEPLLFVGHTHAPAVYELGAAGEPAARGLADFALEPGRRYLVNVGSVGYPRSGVCRSHYCIYDDVARTVSFRSLPFDLEGYREKMKGQGLDEAPWMRAQALRQGGAEVRGTPSFGRPAKKAAKPAAARRLSVRRTTRPEMRGVDGPVRAARPPMAACVLAAVAGVAAAACCAWVLAKRTPPPRAASPQPAAAAAPAAAVAAVPPAAEAALRPLAGGWGVWLEFPEAQLVRTGSHPRADGPVFHIESARSGTVRFVKDLDLAARPPKVHWSVNLLSTVAPRKGQSFAFTVHLRFLDAQGALVGEETSSGKRSASNRATAVPAGAVRAEMTVDCVCEGALDLAVPYFKTEPERRKGAGRTRKERP